MISLSCICIYRQQPSRSVPIASETLAHLRHAAAIPLAVALGCRRICGRETGRLDAETVRASEEA
jgi:hypothetical protein